MHVDSWCCPRYKTKGKILAGFDYGKNDYYILSQYSRFKDRIPNYTNETFSFLTSLMNSNNEKQNLEWPAISVGTLWWW